MQHSPWKIYRVIILIIAIGRSIDFSVEGSDDRIQCNLTKIWGPGLDPVNFVLPARYFFIQAYNENGDRLRKKIGQDVFNVKISSLTQQSCRIRSEVLDRLDGSLVVRYKIYSICSHLAISVRCMGTELSNFPHHIKSTIFPEECACTINNNTDDWLTKFGCRSHYEQIEKDLSNFKVINVDEVFEAARSTLFKDVHRHSICNYVIKSNQVYRKCYGQYTGFKMFMDAILLFITRRVRMPDIEMLVNLGDWPLIIEKTIVNGKEVLIPLFSWCGSESSWDIVLPTYDITESSLESMGRVSLDMLSVQGNTKLSWSDKIPKLFWRGRDSSRERLRLIEISQQNMHLINASLTDFFFFREEQEKYGPKEKRISFFDFFRFKYQLNVDGTVAAYRYPYLLVGDSVVLKQESPYYEFFYNELSEWKEYVPVKRDLSDLVEKVEWAVNHDQQAHEIGLNGQKYARENLLPQNIFCYHVKLFYEYSKKLMNENVKIRSGMEMVSPSHKNECQCEDYTVDVLKSSKHSEL